MSWFSRKNRDKEEVLRDKESLDRGLEKTKRGLFDRLSRAVAGKSKVDDDVLDAIEDALIASDVGVDTTLKIIDMLEERVARDKYMNAAELRSILKEEMASLLDVEGKEDAPVFDFSKKPYVIMVVAGSGRYLPRRGRRPAGDLEREGGSSHSEAEHGCRPGVRGLRYGQVSRGPGYRCGTD